MNSTPTPHVWLPTLFFTLTGLAAGASPQVRAELQPAGQRRAAPTLALPDASGKVMRLGDYSGRVVLLDFWATWCHGCKQEIPWFSEFARQYAGQGLSVVGVSLDEGGWKVLKPFLEQVPISYPVLLGDGSTAKTYDIRNMPVTHLIDRRGRIAATYVGLVDRANVEKNIRALLAQP